VLLVTGDEASCREAKALLGDGLTTVAVQGASARAARMIPPARARR
jgi:D-aminopeptidase